jgi:putative tricarboxylic transport membrane protein
MRVQTRRDVLMGSLAATSALGFGLSSCSQNGQAPNALEVLVPSGPGGGWDQTARTIEYVMRSEGLIDEFRIDHAVGGGGAVGLSRFVSTQAGRADALLVSGLVMVGALAANNSSVRLSETTAIARLTGEYEVVAVHRDSPIMSMRELVELLQADPGAVSWAGGSAGGTDHILVGMIAKAVGVDFREVSYVAYAGGGLAQATLLGNQVTCGVNGYGEFAEQIAAGNLRALAISAPERQSGIDVPTLRDAGVDVDLSNWRGVFGAPGLEESQKIHLIGLMHRMRETPTWRDELAKYDWNDVYLSGDDFAQYLADETARVTEILVEIGLAR